jgi:hypothetical protein
LIDGKPHPLTGKVLQLRDHGCSISDICKSLGMAKSTVSGILKKLHPGLTDEQKSALHQREIDSQKRFAESPERAEWGRMHIHLALEAAKTAGTMLDNESWRVGNLVYLESEKPILYTLNCVFQTNFHKEVVGRHVFDFADDFYLIEHSTCWGKGINSLTARFGAAEADRRTKVAFINTKHFGTVRQSRLQSLGVKWFDISILDRPDEFKTIKGLIEQ